VFSRGIFLGSVIVIFIGAVFFLFTRERMENPRTSQRPTERISVRVGEAVIHAEVARTSAEHARGLSGRSALGENEGMLFVFSARESHSFWMKETHIPLELLWVRDRHVVGIVTMAPEPGVPDEHLTTYPSPGPIDAVLEVPAGWTTRHGIRVGDVVGS
jgi:uncharacterized protein